jgi:hypothetical protein
VTDLLALARAGGIGEPRDVDLADLARRHGRLAGRNVLAVADSGSGVAEGLAIFDRDLSTADSTGFGLPLARHWSRPTAAASSPRGRAARVSRSVSPGLRVSPSASDDRALSSP